MKIPLILILISLASFNVVLGQHRLLMVSPSKFKLLTTDVSYQGETCSPSAATDTAYLGRVEVIRIGHEAFYQANRFYRNDRGDGLVVENFEARTCRIYPMFGLAEAASWIKHDENGPGSPNATRGLYRVGNALWMGSNGIGIAVLDLNRKTWSRYDVKSNVVAGDHLQINYADNDYVFVTRGEFPGTSFNLYSVKHNKWLGLNAVSTKLVSEYGYSIESVQVPVDHRFYAKQKYIPIDWTFMGLQLIDKGDAYSFVNKFSETQTVFEISKPQLEQAFINR